MLRTAAARPPAGGRLSAVEPLDASHFRSAATLLAEGTAFAPDVMARVLDSRAASGTSPLLLGARALSSGRLVGAALLDLHRPVAGGRLFARVGVDPGARGGGVGRALVQHLVRLLPEGRAPLCAEVSGDDERSQRIVCRWGGVEYQRSLSLEADLTDDAWRAGARSAPDPRLTVRAMRPDSPEQLWRAAFDVYAAASMDLPDRAGAPAPSYDMFRAQVDHAPGVHLAWRDGTPIGISGAGPDGPDAWYVFFTGTLRHGRRSGVARALKTALHETALAEGIRTLSTSTLSANTPMLALNASLGYRTTGAIVRYQIV